MSHIGPVRLAIIGLQHNHIHAVARFARNNPKMVLVAVVEPDATRRSWAAAEWAVPTYSTVPELLAKEAVDAVALAPINSEKAALAVQCMMAGLHVIVDKPVATTWDQLTELEQTVKHTGRVLTGMLTLRFDPMYVTARRLYLEGAIGQLVHAWLTRPHKLKRDQRPAWMFSRQTYGGLIADLAIHDMDFFRWLTRSHRHDIDHLVAYHGNYHPNGDLDFEDAAHVMLRLSDGTVGVFEASWFTPGGATVHGHCRAVLTGTEGVIEIDSVQNTVTLTTKFAPPTDILLDETGGVTDDFLKGVLYGGDGMVLPSADTLESTAWTLLARDAADEVGRYRRPR